MDKSLVLNTIKKYLGFKKDKEFADFLQIKPNVLSNWHKRNTYDPELLYTKCDFLNPAYLLTGKGNLIKEALFQKNYTDTILNEKSVIDLTVFLRENHPHLMRNTIYRSWFTAKSYDLINEELINEVREEIKKEKKLFNKK